jgi:hypothetical protein
MLTELHYASLLLLPATFLTDEPRRDSYYIDGRCVSGHPIQLDAEEGRKKNREKKVG